MKDKILKQDQGITYQLFNAEEAAVEEGEGDGEGEEGDEPKKEKVLIEKLPKHIVVNELVREPKMHYYDVPKLGSYLAIKLEYKTCLFEESYDEAVKESLRVEGERAE